jgi:hypothetical protein
MIGGSRVLEEIVPVQDVSAGMAITDGEFAEAPMTIRGRSSGESAPLACE